MAHERAAAYTCPGGERAVILPRPRHSTVYRRQCVVRQPHTHRAQVLVWLVAGVGADREGYRRARGEFIQLGGLQPGAVEEVLAPVVVGDEAEPALRDQPVDRAV